MVSIMELSVMQDSKELFTGSIQDVKLQYMELIRMYHPDSNGQSTESQLASSKINLFYNEAIRRRKEGWWEEKDQVHLLDSNQKMHILKYYHSQLFDMGTVYHSKNYVLYLFEKEYKKYADNFILRTTSFGFADEAMKREFERYLPVEKITFSCNKRTAIIIKKEMDVFSTESILKFYNGKIPAVHTAWILSSIYNLVCYFAFQGINHNEILIQNYFISPKRHSGQMLGGWWFSVAEGEKIPGIGRELYDIMSSDSKASGYSSIELDLEAVRNFGRTILGDKTGTMLAFDSSIPVPMVQWLRSAAGTDPFEEYKKWGKVIIRSFGDRHFTVMQFNEEQYYNLMEDIPL